MNERIYTDELVACHTYESAEVRGPLPEKIISHEITDVFSYLSLATISLSSSCTCTAMSYRPFIFAAMAEACIT